MSHEHGAGGSPVHRLPALTKLAVGFVLIVGTVTVPLRWTWWFATVVLILALAITVSRIPLSFFIRRLLLLSPLIGGVALARAFQPAGSAPWWAVSIRSGVSLLTVLVISNTTPFTHLLKVLRLVRVPNMLITTVALMHRYLSVLSDEAERMRRARLGRTFVRRRRVEWRSLAGVISQLFVRSSERAERIYHAMCARGWK